MQPQNGEIVEKYTKRIHNFLQKKAANLKKSDLANYVSHRKVIIDLLEKAIEQSPTTGRYVREKLIHELIVPTRKDPSEVFLDSCNLWLNKI